MWIISVLFLILFSDFRWGVMMVLVVLLLLLMISVGRLFKCLVFFGFLCLLVFCGLRCLFVDFAVLVLLFLVVGWQFFLVWIWKLCLLGGNVFRLGENFRFLLVLVMVMLLIDCFIFCDVMRFILIFLLAVCVLVVIISVRIVRLKCFIGFLFIVYFWISVN